MYNCPRNDLGVRLHRQRTSAIANMSWRSQVRLPFTREEDSQRGSSTLRQNWCQTACIQAHDRGEWKVQSLGDHGPGEARVANYVRRFRNGKGESSEASSRPSERFSEEAESWRSRRDCGFKGIESFGTSRISRHRIGPLSCTSLHLEFILCVSLFGWCLLFACPLLVFKRIQILFVFYEEVEGWSGTQEVTQG